MVPRERKLPCSTLASLSLFPSSIVPYATMAGTVCNLQIIDESARGQGPAQADDTFYDTYKGIVIDKPIKGTAFSDSDSHTADDA